LLAQQFLQKEPAFTALHRATNQ